MLLVPCITRRSSCDEPSEYTQSVTGHGKQQSTVPSAVGTGAQKRPCRSGCMSASRGEHSRLFGRHLHPSVLGKFDNCKKGALQSPRAMVMFAIAYKALGDLVPKYSGCLVAVCMFWSDIHQWLLIWHQDIVYSPGLDVMHLAISCLRQSKLVLGPRE